MKKQTVAKYAAEEVEKGRSHQEIYDHIIATSGFNIHDVAEMVRRIPTVEKRKKYNLAQVMLLVLICLFIAAKVISGFETSIIFNQVHLTIAILSLILPLFLFYGVLRYKRNMHLVTGAWMVYGSVAYASGLMITLSIPNTIGLFICIWGACLAFYLGNKLPGDYIINKELQKSNPEQRENLITFMD
jgi:hypothetical protein